jgi:uridine kinase
MVFLITIAGGSGSGKTNVAEIISKGHEKDVTLISMDNYYKDLKKLKLSSRNKVNFDHPAAIDWKLFIPQMEELLKGNSIQMPKYSFLTHTREGYVVVKPKKIIIIEGIFALYDKKINNLANLRIFIDTDADLCFIRRLKRDLKERKRSPESVIQQWLKTVKPMYDQYVAPTKKRAHIIIPEDPEQGMRDTAIDIIMSKIKNILRD